VDLDLMVALPAAAMVISLICAAILGWDALKRPRPDRVSWAIAFGVFALAAGAEVVGSLAGWSAPLARVYYLSGAVLVVGILALGELYLLFGDRMPAVTPGIALLVCAMAATVVWNAPVNQEALDTLGWGAIERGPLLVAVAATINAGGTAVLVGGALYSSWRLRRAPGLKHRAIGCAMIAAGAVIVAMGGTLTRFGQREYLYLAMTAGVTIIFAGVLLTRYRAAAPGTAGKKAEAFAPDGAANSQVILMPARTTGTHADEGVRYVLENLLPLDVDDLRRTCLQWGATPVCDAPLTRKQAARVWALRRALPDGEKGRFDLLPLALQCQLAELHAEIWSSHAVGA
jgi:energy-converting hydrogenase Eha subunit A